MASIEVQSEKQTSRRRKTAHLKLVPPTKAERESLRQVCADLAMRLDKSRPLTKDAMEKVARRILEELGLPEGFVGWTMVCLATEFWREQVAAIPPQRRLFLLPHCLKHAEGCPADYDKFGLDCKTCGACSIADFRTTAEDLGYKVLVAEGSPIVLKIIVSGYVDAIVGVACLNVLEKAIDKILLAGIPCMAVPLLSSDCRNTSVDEDWVAEMIRVPHRPAVSATRSFVHLLRASSGMFAMDELERLAPRVRGGARLAEMNGHGVGGLDPLAATEAIAYDFLTRGGKHLRPFVTLAVYDALRGGAATRADGARAVEQFPDAVKRAAMSIETFHKASLVHDDIEDDDPYRYGSAALHRALGIPTAINVGDYLIGLGYRLVSGSAGDLGGEAAAQILDYLADSHLRLAEGQGAELLWRDSPVKQITPIDVLKIYALKTAPAFEAAFLAGIRLAGPVGDYAEPIKKFSRDLGIAFQILNDLHDWRGDAHNKRSRGLDLIAGRPTLLWALALESLPTPERDRWIELMRDADQPPSARLAQIEQLFRGAGVFEAAQRLVDKYEERCRDFVESVEPLELREVFRYLIEVILDRPADFQPTIPFSEPTSITQIEVASRPLGPGATS